MSSNIPHDPPTRSSLIGYADHPRQQCTRGRNLGAVRLGVGVPFDLYALFRRIRLFERVWRCSRHPPFCAICGVCHEDATARQCPDHAKDAGLTRRRTLSLIGTADRVLAAPSVVRRAGAQDVYECRIAHSEAISSPLTNAFEVWALLLREQSDGRIDAQHFPASQFGSYTQLIEGNRIGSIEITAGGPDTEEAVAPEIAATGGAPDFIYRDEANVDAVLQGPSSDVGVTKTVADLSEGATVGGRAARTGASGRRGVRRAGLVSPFWRLAWRSTRC